MKNLICMLLLASTLGLRVNADQADAAKADTNTPESMGRIPVETSKYITGGVLASAVGFGIGHGIQGRYNEKGWIFTATEVASVVALGVGISSCDTMDKKATCSNNGLITLGALSLVGFHVWEIIDAWTGARPVDVETKAIFVPDPNKPSIGVVINF